MAEIDFGDSAVVTAPDDRAPVALIVCEHASNRVPDALHSLGVKPSILDTHIAWDPGAREVAGRLGELLSAVVVQGNVSRLVYDCNRPPEAKSAVPEKSAIYPILGNQNLSTEARQQRVDRVYHPFRTRIEEQITSYSATLRLLVTIHSFTPVYHGTARSVEIGVLHGRDARFAGAMMNQTRFTSCWDTRLNEPYKASDGVAHTLDLHGDANGLLNVMIEIRNDLIRSVAQQGRMAAHLAGWIRETLLEFSAHEAKP